jgi:hypothetical protein
MGWNPFKSLKKIVKKIGKGIKKIGKGIKKVIGKIAKPFAKLGIVGQIALGVMMPWAAGAVWQGLTGTAFSMANLGTVATNLAGSSNVFASVAGNVMKGVHWGATRVQGAFSSITEAMSNGLNTMKTKAKELFGINADASDLIKNAPDMKEFDLGTNLSEKAVSDVAASKTVEGQLASTIPDVLTDKTAEKVAAEATDKTLLSQVVDKGKEAILEAPKDLIGGTVTSVLGGVQEGIARTIAPEPEVPYSSEVADFLSEGAATGYTKYNEVDFSKLSQYNDAIGSQAGIYANPLHTVQTMTDNSFGLNTFEYWKSQGFANTTGK